jgi:hypothetical protein
MKKLKRFLRKLTGNQNKSRLLDKGLLVIRYPDYVSFEEADEVAEDIVEAVKGGSLAILLPEDYEIEVLR